MICQRSVLERWLWIVIRVFLKLKETLLTVSMTKMNNGDFRRKIDSKELAERTGINQVYNY